MQSANLLQPYRHRAARGGVWKCIGWGFPRAYRAKQKGDTLGCEIHSKPLNIRHNVVKASFSEHARQCNTLVKDYTADGLNPYTAVDSDSCSYDAGGNLTDDGVHSHVYDTENGLIEEAGYTFSATHLSSVSS